MHTTIVGACHQGCGVGQGHYWETPVAPKRDGLLLQLSHVILTDRARSRGSPPRADPASSAVWVGCDPVYGSAIARRRTTPWRCVVGSYGGPPRRSCLLSKFGLFETLHV